MPRLVVVDREGVRHDLEATVGWTLMEIMREAGLPIEAACGGACACATCHVYLDETFATLIAPPSPDEDMMLDEAFMVQPSSRLSCQIAFTSALDGITVRLAPEF